jgi:hypothetical protein
VIRQVGIQFVHALEGVMLDVVLGERYRCRHGERQVSQHAGQDVGGGAAEDQLVRGLVDHDEQRVVCEGADEVRHEDDEPPRLIAKHECESRLQGHDAKRVPERHRILADELADLRMRFQDRLGAVAVRLRPRRVLKIKRLRRHVHSWSCVREEEDLPYSSLIISPTLPDGR